MFLVSISQGQIEGISPLWTQEELRTANTTKEARTYMHSSERDIITVLNLARLYPQRFVELELTIEKEDYDYEYKRSLINHMLSMEPIHAVKPNQSMYQLARCWAKESGELGLTGHERIQCNDGLGWVLLLWTRQRLRNRTSITNRLRCSISWPQNGMLV